MFPQWLAALCKQELSYLTEYGWQAFKRITKYATGADGSAGNPSKCRLEKNLLHGTTKKPRARATHTHWPTYKGVVNKAATGAMKTFLLKSRSVHFQGC
eukprot:3275861-Ditylum_brightwellii.AAC.1